MIGNPTFIPVVDGQGKTPIQLTILHPDASAPIEIIYIFEHTTVQEFLEILNKETV